MFRDVIQICQGTIQHGADIKKVSQLTGALSTACMKYTIQTRKELPYGRYLIHQDKTKRFHIELHIFSREYTGNIHCHKTWGIFWLLSGSLFIEDFIFKNDQLYQTRSTLLRRGSALNFFPPQSDWHRVSNQQKSRQTLSLHVYGSGYDQKMGIYLDENNQTVKAKRSPFRNNSLFIPFLK